MNNQEKYDYCYQLTQNASSGFSFLEDYLAKNKQTDCAYLRTVHILLPYYTELMLKSRILASNNVSDKDGMINLLKKSGHDLKKIGKTLGSGELLKIGIQNIEKTPGLKYRFEVVSENTFEIEDFANIRYDFLEDKRHVVNSGEHKKIEDIITLLSQILMKIKEENIKIKK